MNLIELVAQISQSGGVARTNRFRVLLNAANVISNNPIFQATQTGDPNMLRRLALFCDRAEFPSKFFATSDVRHYGATYRQPYQAIYSTVQLQFLVGNDMKEKYFFESWMQSIEDPTTQDFAFYKDYVTTIWIQQISEVFGDVPYYSVLYDAWPIGMSNMNLDYAQTDTPHRLTIDFAFRRWVNNVTDVEAGSTFTPPTVTRFSNDIIPKAADK